MVVGCASRQQLAPDKNKIVVPGVIAVAGRWYKKKGSKVDASILVRNESGQFLFIPNSDLQCLMGDSSVKAELRIDFARSDLNQVRNALDDQIRLSPDEAKTLEIVCRSDDGGAHFGIRVQNVYRRVSEAGDAVKVQRIGGDITWWAPPE
jgi:hypothetical protein